MVKISVFICFLFLLTTSLKAQYTSYADTIVFSGVVLKAGNLEPLADVSCRFGRGVVISDSTGRFILKTTRGDTVKFTYVGMKPYAVVIPDTLSEKEYMMGIFMAADTIQLAEAFIVRRLQLLTRQQMINARNNMSGILRQAYAPVQDMDADMNQRRMINEYARSVEMRGHVNVGLGIGTDSWAAFKQLRLQKKLRDEKKHLNYEEVKLLKTIYYLEKRENINN